MKSAKIYFDNHGGLGKATSMANFYKILPSNLSWSGIRLMPREELKRLLPRASFFFRPFGSFYQVRLHNDVVIKTSRDEVLFLSDPYERTSLLEKARGMPVEPAVQLLRVGFPGFHKDILDVYLRAKADLLSYGQLCENIPKEHLVQQSIAITWRSWRKTILGLNEILIQPFVPGPTLSDMLPSFPRINGPDLKRRYKHLTPEIGPQLRYFSGSAIVDLNMPNFILSPEGKFVYIDYQPILESEGLERNKSYIDRMLKKWGY